MSEIIVEAFKAKRYQDVLPFFRTISGIDEKMLLSACRINDPEAIDWCLKNQLNPGSKFKEIVIESIKNGIIKVLEYFSHLDPDTDERKFKSIAPVYDIALINKSLTLVDYAVENNQIETMKWLLNRGFKGFCHTGNACACGYLPIVKFLMENNHEFNMECIEMAIQNHHFDIADYLDSKGIRIKNLGMAIHFKILQDLEAVKWLYSHGYTYEHKIDIQNVEVLDFLINDYISKNDTPDWEKFGLDKIISNAFEWELIPLIRYFYTNFPEMVDSSRFKKHHLERCVRNNLAEDVQFFVKRGLITKKMISNYMLFNSSLEISKILHRVLDS